MSSTKLNRLTRWGSAALALSLVPGCSTSPGARATADTAQSVEWKSQTHESSKDKAPPPAPVEAGPAQEETEAAPTVGAVMYEKAEASDAKADVAMPSPKQAPAKGGAVAYPERRREAVERKPAEPMVDALAGAPAAPTTPPPPPARSLPPPGNTAMQPEPPSQGNSFTHHAANAFTETAKDRFSTFAVDVDTASYAVSRRYLNQGALPPHAAVRVEEFVNYFKYRYTPPEQGAFTVHLEGAPSPFNASRQFVRVGVQGKIVSRSQRKPAHLVFLVDTSGSMSQQDKLPLAKEAMKLAVKNLNENDTVAIVTYAGNTRDVLSPTPATNLEAIYKAIDTLESGGGTAMGSGMQMAYKHAVKKASGNAVARVVVLTDGDANIGPNVSADAMLNSIQGYVKEGVTLSAIGFGMGNYRDDLMEKLANKGNGNCFYIDSYKEAKKVFETQLTGTLEVIAKDVKLQVEFDPKMVSRYRLVGYENRDIADKDFRDDKVDAGEIGAGHSVTAVYEVELTGEKAPLGTVRIRAKAPNGTEAAEQAFPFEQRMMRATLDGASADFRFALAVAATADVLRGSPSAQGWNLATVQKLAEGAVEGQADREEFTKLVARARGLLGSSMARDGR
ncbi:vWA domain-containing protein [Archangium lansingense]|uniref:von Willebrand factor type A domain-containing protein n=1 Tax=Archangium lansingense TaxID=2995310 RepID=A0ABT4AA75_9BACT|nr:von Willebrand factor type A domain-containing protein [Archangium lansinium]MCY1078520.1 von Willebrand factor type A domain-containing protein [Archangium lansinium]